MKKAMMRLFTYLVVFLTSPFKTVSADELRTTHVRPMTNEADFDKYISALYKQIDFGNYRRLSYEVFNKAYRGFVNLRNAGKLNSGKEIISVCDLSLPSSEKRLWIIDLSNMKVLFNTYVAHGRGSGEEYASAFSNSSNSHQSSLGFYVTGETYNGVHGTSLRLTGMDEGYNDAALSRGIVVHGASYVSEKFLKENNYLGRSWGCPAVPAKLSLPIINAIKDGTCLFIYFPEKRYLQASSWLNGKISGMPGSNIA
jgi:hypothetical protein